MLDGYYVFENGRLYGLYDVLPIYIINHLKILSDLFKCPYF